MASHPIPPDPELDDDDVDPETARIILERLATLDEDRKGAKPWPEIEARILDKLKTIRPR